MNSSSKSLPLPLAQIDARAVFLFSREIQTMNLRDGCSGLGEMFTYYDSIQVAKINEPGAQPLTAAYDFVMEKYKNQKPDPVDRRSKVAEFSQTLLLFTDVKDVNSTNLVGHTAEEIDTFWANTEKQPILFLTMFHLGRDVALTDAIMRVSNMFHGRRHLIYLGFDYSDVVLFYRGSSFQEFTELIMRIDYQENNPIVADSVTLYSFYRDYCDKATETFRADFKIGVTDYSSAKKAIDKLSKNWGGTMFRWTLGRNDVAVCNDNANLRWIMAVHQMLDSTDQEHDSAPVPWCTTRKLSIFIPVPENNQVSGKTDRAIIVSNIRDVLARKSEEFKTAYENRCAKLKVQVDSVWLDWLSNSSLWAATFFDNKMSENMGICLVPQYLDMFEYETRLLSCEKLTISDLKEARNGMSNFFTSILTLIDSMNPSNRQSVQAPAFRVETFDMPPRIMAYYTAVTQTLIDALRDNSEDRQILYSFAISPQFTQTLKVSSLALQNVLPKHQFILIGIGERSLYTLQLTTQALTHEVSHLVGEYRRCRKERSGYMIKCALHRVISYVLKGLYNRLSPLYGVQFPALSAEQKEAGITKIYDALIRSNTLYVPSPDHHSPIIVERIDSLANELYSNPSVNKIFFDVIWGLMFPDVESSYESVTYRTMLEKLLIHKLPLPKEDSEVKTYLERLQYEEMVRSVKCLVRRVFNDELNRMSKGKLFAYNGADDSPEYMDLSLSRDICNQFKEVFADLQTILLLELDFPSYYRSLDLKNDPESDLTVRILAVVQTLKGNYWPVDDMMKFLQSIHNQSHIIITVSSLIKFDPLLDVEKYSKQGVDPFYVFYLSEYLMRCKSYAYKSFSADSHNISAVQRIRNIHKSLDVGTSVLDMQNTILSLIRDYKKHIEQRQEGI